MTSDVLVRLNADGTATITGEGVESQMRFDEAKFSDDPEALEIYLQSCRESAVELMRRTLFPGGAA